VGYSPPGAAAVLADGAVAAGGAVRPDKPAAAIALDRLPSINQPLYRPRRIGRRHRVDGGND
jgi:hypothetical protein